MTTRLVFGPELDHYNFSYQAQAEQGTHGFKAILHHTDPGTECMFALGNYGNQGADLSCTFAKHWNRPGKAYVSGGIEFDKWYDVRLEVRGPSFKCFVDGKELLSARDERFTKGRIGFSTWESVSRFRQLEVTEPNGTVIWRGLPVVGRPMDK